MSVDYEVTYLGDTVRITTNWYSWVGALVDLASHLIKIYDPKGTLLGTYTTPVKDSTGIYHYDWTVPATAEGSYLCWWKGTHTGGEVKSCKIVIAVNDPLKH